MRLYKQSFKNAEHKNIRTIDFDAFYDDAGSDWERKARRTQLRHWRKIMRQGKHHAAQ